MTHSPALTLLSCPHCGGPARFGACAVEEADESGAEYIECEVCSASTALVFPCMDSAKENLVERWNRRAELAASADAGSRPYTHEHHFALREAHCVSAGEAFWAARPGTKDAPRAIAFDAEFVRGFDIATKLADERAALARPAQETSKIADERSQNCTNGATSARGAPVSAQGDERAAFEGQFAYPRGWRNFTRNDGGYYTADEGRLQAMWTAWQARAQVAQGDGVDAWAELCRRVYVELFYCDQQMTSGRKKWQQGPSVRDALRDAKAALEARDAARAQQGGQR